MSFRALLASSIEGGGWKWGRSVPWTGQLSEAAPVLAAGGTAEGGHSRPPENAVDVLTKRADVLRDGCDDTDRGTGLGEGPNTRGEATREPEGNRDSSGAREGVGAVTGRTGLHVGRQISSNVLTACW